MTYLLGVDLGTTFTAAAVANGMPPSMVGLGNRSLQVPSVLFLADETFVVGEAAERRGVLEPSRLAREFKRRLGDHVPVLVGGSPFSAELLTARLLQWIVVRVSERMGERPAEVVITHPANWGPYKMEVLAQVAALADVGPTSWAPEPVAAAAQYASRTRVESGARVAVYDLGGGTFDACVLEKVGDGFVVLGIPDGVEHLGGVDFDAALYQHVLDSVAGELPDVDSEDPAVLMGLARLRRDCVDAKEALSTDLDIVIPVALPRLSTTVRVTRAELEALIRPALAETTSAVGRALRSASVTPEELTAIVLVGGSSRIPLVAEMLQHSFGIPVAVDSHPKHDVALGAVRAAQGAPAARSRTSRPPAADQLLKATSPTSAEAAIGRPTSTVEEGDIGSLSAPGTVEPPPRRRRLALLLGGAAAVATAVVVIGMVVVDNDPSSSGPAAPSTPLPEVPRSAPLLNSQLLIPMQVDGNWEIYLADVTESGPVRALTDSSGVDVSPALSPDRASVIYGHNDPGEATRQLRIAGAADGSGDRLLFDPVPQECAATTRRPAWNPVDPTMLVVACSEADENDGLYLIRIDGTVLSEIQVDEERVGDPSISPDGRQLVFWAGSEEGFEGDPGDDGGSLYVTNADGSGTPERLTSAAIDGQDADPAWSPDGTTIAFRRRVPDGSPHGNSGIFTVAADGSGKPARLTDQPSDETDPSWSPLGDALAFKSTVRVDGSPGRATPRIWVMESDGADPRLLWADEADHEQGAPVWTRR